MKKFTMFIGGVYVAMAGACLIMYKRFLDKLVTEDYESKEDEA